VCSLHSVMPEFASMVPVAGSAYTYAFMQRSAKLFAWIIGWDLVLEYAVGSARSHTGGRHTSRSSFLYLDLINICPRYCPKGHSTIA